MWNQCYLVYLSFLLLALCTGVFTCPHHCRCDYLRMGVVCKGQAIRKIPRGLPQDIRSLAIFGTEITVIDDELRGYSQLQALHLADNRLAIIKASAFKGLYNLRHLDLSHNHLTDELLNKYVFAGLHKLLLLNLETNFITKINGPVFEDLASLYKLYLGENKIEYLSDDAFQGLGDLRFLRLWNNQLTYIPTYSLKHTPKLSTLSLHQNMIKEVPALAFTYAPSIVSLDLDANWIEHVHNDAFANLQKLEQLHLHQNNLKNIPKLAIGKCSKLEHIDLDHNPIVHVSANSFQGLANLKTVKLSYMDLLEAIDGEAFAYLPSLEALYMHSNPNLVEIASNAFGENHNLDTVQLHNNALEFIDEYMLPWEQLRALWLHGNPWKCDCNLKWLGNLAHVMSWNMHPTKCFQPALLKHKVLGVVDAEEFVC